MKTEFIQLGNQPIANNLRPMDDKTPEFKFRLGMIYDSETYLVSLTKFVSKSLLFSATYPYRTASSSVMVDHFNKMASLIKDKYDTDLVLEIGSNDGTFIKNFDSCIAIEPCENFARELNEQDIPTLCKFWNKETAKEIVSEYGKPTVIFAANCMCHIPEIEEAFEAISLCLDEDGVFIFEDPWILPTIQNNSFDQFYDEHAHIFSVHAIREMIGKYNLYIYDSFDTDMHGGSMVYILKKYKYNIATSVFNSYIKIEEKFNLNKIETYLDFSKRVQENKVKLIEMFDRYRLEGLKVIGYGATSKLTVVANYCGLTMNNIAYIVDTTPEKWGKLLPGTNIPIIKYEGIPSDVDVAFLGAWNYKDYIINKEKEFISRGGKFFTHVPCPREVS